MGRVAACAGSLGRGSNPHDLGALIIESLEEPAEEFLSILLVSLL